jgi:hypothetical protein
VTTVPEALRSILRAGAFVFAVALASGCGDPAPEPGTLSLRLTTPNPDDGALLFELNGPEISNPVAGGTLQLFTNVTGATQLRAALIGSLTAGTVMTFTVPNIHASGSYTATILEVAVLDNRLRTSTAGYKLTVVR